MPTCPICRKPFTPSPNHRFGPLCSERCYLLDLSAWLGEDYRVPGEPAEDAPAEPEEGSR